VGDNGNGDAGSWRMTPKVITGDEDTPVTQISKDMELSGVGSVVITRDGKPVGII